MARGLKASYGRRHGNGTTVISPVLPHIPPTFVYHTFDTCFCLDGLEEQGIARIKGMKMLSGNGENPGTDDVGVQLDDVVCSR